MATIQLILVHIFCFTLLDLIYFADSAFSKLILYIEIRLQGFCLTLSRLPTSRRRFFEVVKAIEQYSKDLSSLAGGNNDIETAR